MATKKIDLKLGYKITGTTKPTKIGNQTIDQIKQRLASYSASQKATPKLSTFQKDYVKELGYQPRTMPESRAEKPATGIGAVFDILNRPLSGVMNYFNRQAKDIGDAVYNKDINAGFRAGAKTLFPILGIGDFAEGALGDRRVYGENVVDTVLDRPEFKIGSKTIGVDKITENPWVRGGAGFVADVALDPMTYVSVGALAKATKLDKVIKPVTDAIMETPKLGGFLKKMGVGVDETYKMAKGSANKADAAATVFSSGVKNIMDGSVQKGSKEYEAIMSTVDYLTKSKNGATKALSVIGKNVDEVGDVGGVIKKSLDGLSSELNKLQTATKLSRQEVLDTLEKVVSREILDPKYEKAASAWRTMMKTMSGELSGAGLLKPDQIGNFQTYFHKIYDKTKSTIDPNVITKQGGIDFGTAGDILKQDIPEAQRVIDAYSVVKKGGQVGNLTKADFADPKVMKEFESLYTGFAKNMGETAASDKAIATMVAKHPELFSPTNPVFNPFRVAGEARRAAGMVTGKTSDVFATTLEKQFKVLSVDKFHKAVGQFAKEPRSVAEVGDLLSKGYKKLSNSKDLGQLAGKYVPSYMVDDLEGVLSLKFGWMDKALSFWKKEKLFSPLNFATPVRNNLSNVVLNSLVEDGLPVYRMDIYTRAFKELSSGGKYFKEFRSAGGGLTGAMKSEINALSKSEGVMKSVDKVFKPMMKVQADSEELAKIAQFIWQREKGKSIDEALRIAEKATFDYSTVPNLVRQFGNNFMPFVSFKYLASQLALDTLIHRTGKLTQFDKAKRAIESVTAEEEGQPLPAWMEENRSMQVRTPFTDEQGNRIFQDLTYMYPFGDITGGYNPADLLLGNPFLRAGVELGTGQNLYYNQPITDSNLPDEQWKDRVKYLVQNLGPATPLMPGSRQQDKLLQAGKPDKYGNVRNIPSALLDVFGGIKLKSINYKDQGKLNQYKNKAQKNSIKAEISKVKKDQSLSDRERDAKIEKLQLMLDELE